MSVTEQHYEPEVVTADPTLSITGRMYDKLPYEVGPQWGVGEMARTFFARSAHWVRWLENSKIKDDYLVLDGKPVARRKDSAGVRVYGLRDVEDFAYALAENGRLDGTRLRSVLLALFYVGEIHGLQTQGIPVTSDGKGWKMGAAKAPDPEPDVEQED